MLHLLGTNLITVTCGFIKKHEQFNMFNNTRYLTTILKNINNIIILAKVISNKNITSF